MIEHNEPTKVPGGAWDWVGRSPKHRKPPAPPARAYRRWLYVLALPWAFGWYLLGAHWGGQDTGNTAFLVGLGVWALYGLLTWKLGKK